MVTPDVNAARVNKFCVLVLLQRGVGYKSYGDNLTLKRFNTLLLQWIVPFLLQYPLNAVSQPATQEIAAVKLPSNK